MRFLIGVFASSAIFFGAACAQSAPENNDVAPPAEEISGEMTGASKTKRF